MSQLTKSYKEHLYERLQDPAQAAGYINAVLEEEDMEAFLLALRDVAEARGIGKVAAAAKLNREHLYRTLSDQGNPRLSSLIALLQVMGIRLAAEPIVFNSPMTQWEERIVEVTTAAGGAGVRSSYSGNRGTKIYVEEESAKEYADKLKLIAS